VCVCVCVRERERERERECAAHLGEPSTNGMPGIPVPAKYDGTSKLRIFHELPVMEQD